MYECTTDVARSLPPPGAMGAGVSVCAGNSAVLASADFDADGNGAGVRKITDGLTVGVAMATAVCTALGFGSAFGFGVAVGVGETAGDSLGEGSLLGCSVAVGASVGVGAAAAIGVIEGAGDGPAGNGERLPRNFASNPPSNNPAKITTRTRGRMGIPPPPPPRLGGLSGSMRRRGRV